MSRVGLKPIPLPEKVDVQLAEGALTFKGPKGTLTTPIPRGITAKLQDREITFARGADDGPSRALHGLTRALANNALVGVTTGFERRLEIVGVGFRAAVQSKALVLNIGYSHPVEYPIPEGIAVAIEETTKVVIRGNDKQQVGQVAAEIRSLRPPDAYKGKGIRYVGEVIKLKAGKTGSK
jgi:large subunit ribosomal protein L6